MPSIIDKQSVQRLAAGLDPVYIRRTIDAIWQQARQMDFPAMFRAAEAAAQRLRASGVEDVRIEKIPADGVTSAGGWLMPPCWAVESARLEAAGGSRNVYADYSANPQNIALYSPPTPGGRWVEGPLVELDGDEKALAEGRLPAGARRRLRRAFLLLRQSQATMAANRAVAAAGGLGIVKICPGPLHNAARYLNYAVPFNLESPCVPVFSLTLADGNVLNRDRQSGNLVLRARVRARRQRGFFPMLTGSIGAGDPPVYLCAHIDEIGALDNASGVGLACEVLRVLQAEAERRDAPPQRRQIRFYFSVEVRGEQWWFNNRERQQRFMGGLNIDIVGADTQHNGVMKTLTGFRHHPHFARRVLLEAVGRADRVVGGQRHVENANGTSDGVPGLEEPGGHVSLEQTVNAVYHSSADTPALLNDDSLRWSGVAAAAFLHGLTRLDNGDLLAMARQAGDELHRGERAAGPGKATEQARLRRELASLAAAAVEPNLYPDFNTPEEFYAAGVSRTTGLWPEVAQREEILRILAGHAVRGERPKLPAPRNILVPQVNFRGFLAFEDCDKPADRAALAAGPGLVPYWGTEGWAWMLASCFRGKLPLEYIVAELNRIGVAVGARRAEALTRYLVARGLARLRTVIDRNALRAALRAAGVRRGSILMVHSSLSRFGYLPGGPRAVVDTLLDLLGPDGTLVMPAHSNSVLGVLPYDPRTSRSNVGAITEYFRKQPGVIRSPHPTHSVAAYGPAAAELCAGPLPHQAPLDRAGFWGKLYELNGDVLLLCPITSATIFHVAETWLGLPQKNLIAHALDRHGKRHVYVLPNAPWHVNHFEPTMARPLLQRGIMRRVRLGEDSIHFGPARAMSDIGLQVVGKDPLVIVGKNGACNCPYCRPVKDGLAGKH